MRNAGMMFSLALGLCAGALSACGADDGSESCFEKKVKRDTSVGICNLTSDDIYELAGRRPRKIHSACFPIASCPDACPADDVIATILDPTFVDQNPDFEIQDSVPLCLEDDVAAAQCCFWVVYAGIDNSP